MQTHLFFIKSLAICISIISLSTSCREQKEQSPNIIIIYTDDQGTLDTGCYGARDLHTPNIDHLSQTGIRFTQAYADEHPEIVERLTKLYNTWSAGIHSTRIE